MDTVNKILKTKGHDVFTTTPDTHVMDALRMMNDKRIGALIIMQDEEIKGVFTEQDFIRRVLLKDIDSSNLQVESVMTKDVISIPPTQTVNASMQLMTDKHIRHIPVVDDGKLVGIISVGDCVVRVIAEQEQIIGHLEQYIQS